MCTDKTYRTKVTRDFAPLGISVDYSVILEFLVQEIEEKKVVPTEEILVKRFYEKMFEEISTEFFAEINRAKSSVPERINYFMKQCVSQPVHKANKPQISFFFVSDCHFFSIFNTLEIVGYRHLRKKLMFRSNFWVQATCFYSV